MTTSPSLKHLVLTTALFAACSAPERRLWSGQQPPDSSLWGQLEPGSHRVGFRLIEAWDRSRGFYGLEARPIRIGVWYPSDSDVAVRPLNYGDYVHRFETDLQNGFARPDVQERRRIELRWGERFSAKVRDRLLATTAAAAEDAPPADGEYPLVIYAPGFGATPTSHIVTAEYLASHGYVVAATPSLGAGPPGIAFDETGLETQARDLEFVLGALFDSPGVSSEYVGVVGFSFGGSSALLTAMRDERVSVVVSLDGSVGAQHAHAFTRNAPGFAAARLRVPILHMGRLEAPWRDPTLMNELALARRWWLDIAGAEHLDFIPIPTMSHAAGASVPEHRLRVYRTVAGYLLRFLDAHLRRDAGAIRALSDPSFDGGLDATHFDLSVSEPTATAPSGLEFWRRLRDPATTEDAIQDYRSLSKQLGGMPLMTSGEMDDAGSTLLRLDKRRGIEVLRLWVEAYPETVMAHVTLGDALVQFGDPTRAARAFRKALALDPRSALAKRGLRRVEESN